jgi:hypothetical protein
VNITSYNIGDVGYHYIGLRALAGTPTSTRDEQTSTISRNVLKYENDKALRLMLPAPRGTFEAVGGKVCQELLHFALIQWAKGGYVLTGLGQEVLQVLNARDYVRLRRTMAELHLSTYDNVRQILQKHLEVSHIYSPVVDAKSSASMDRIVQYLEPTFKTRSEAIAASVLSEVDSSNAKKVENALRDRIIQHFLPHTRVGVSLFRAICDRLMSLRLLNTMRATIRDCEFDATYSPCRPGGEADGWYRPLTVQLPCGDNFSLSLCEPDMADRDAQERLLSAIDQAFSTLPSRAGYYELPEVRDFACERLRTPEGAFDEGVNRLLDRQPSPLTVGLQYEHISARRRPLVRTQGNVQIFNLIRRASCR